MTSENHIDIINEKERRVRLPGFSMDSIEGHGVTSILFKDVDIITPSGLEKKVGADEAIKIIDEYFKDFYELQKIVKKNKFKLIVK
jgi:hypothetical protein